MSGDYTPVNEDERYTLTASAAITGGQLVTISGVNTCAPAGVGDWPLGVAAYDAASGTRVTIIDEDLIHETTTTAGVTAGDLLKVGAGGTVETDGSPAAGITFGIAFTTAAALGKARWKGL